MKQVFKAVRGPIKGFGGIAAAPAAVGLIALAASGQIMAAAGALGSVVLLSRVMRNNNVLRLLTSSRMRKSDYEAALKAGADLPDLNVVKAQGEKVYNLNRLGSILASEASLIAGSGILGEMGGEERKQIETKTREFGEDPTIRNLPTTGGERSPRISPELFDPSRVNPQGGTPNFLRQQNSLRNQELRKLMGIQ